MNINILTKFQTFMRKQILSGLLMTAALAFSLSSCQREEVLNGGTSQEVSISVLVPDNRLVKSNADPGNASEVNRCILEIYDSEGQIVGSRQTVAVTDNSADFTATLTIGNSYRFVFWADHVADAADLTADLNYSTTDLRAITYAGNAFTNNNDQLDAFFLSETKAVEAAMSFTLKRPFGQVRIISTSGIDTDLSNASVKVSFDNAPTIFNAIDGTIGSETASLSPAGFTDFANVTATVQGERQLTFDYIFAAPEDQTLVNITLETEGIAGLDPISVANVPVQRNYRTNIRGNILPDQTGTEVNIEVSIQPGFDGDDINVGDAPYDPGDIEPTPVDVNNAALNYYGTLNGTSNYYYNLIVSNQDASGWTTDRFGLGIYSSVENHGSIPAGTYRFSSETDVENTFCLTECMINNVTVTESITDGVLTIDNSGNLTVSLDIISDEARYTLTYTGEADFMDYTAPNPDFPESATMTSPVIKIGSYSQYEIVVGNLYHFTLEINDTDGTGYNASLDLYAGLDFDNGTISFSDDEFSFSDGEGDNTAGTIRLGEWNSYIKNGNGARTDIKGGTLSVSGGTVSGALLLQGNVEISFSTDNGLDLNGQSVPMPGSNVTGDVNLTYDGDVNAYAYLHQDCWHITIAPVYQNQGPALSLDLLHGGNGSLEDISGTYTCAATGEANTFYPGCMYPESYPTIYGVAYYNCVSASFQGDYATISEGSVTITQTNREEIDQWTIKATCDVVLSGNDPNGNAINITYSGITVDINDNQGSSYYNL